MIPHTLAAAAVIVIYALLMLAFPTGRCPRCLGRRVTRTRKCRTCNGTGRRVYPFATAVHRFYWLVLGNRRMEQRRQQQRDERSQP
jgi:DnaJ-class molecular chaperone